MKMGGGLVLGVSHAPDQKGQSPIAPKFCGFSSVYTTAFNAERPRSTRQHVRRGVYPCLPFQRQRSSGAPNFGVLLDICLHPLTQNDQVRINTLGEGRVFRSTTPLHLNKCVARFVSDSRVTCHAE